MPLKIMTNEKKEGVFIISPVGEIDSQTYEGFEREITSVLERRPRAVVIDMEGVVYLSSMGLSSILKSKRDAEEKNISFILTNLQPRIRKVFEIVKVIPRLLMFSSRQEVDAYLLELQKEDNGA